MQGYINRGKLLKQTCRWAGGWVHAIDIWLITMLSWIAAWDGQPSCSSSSSFHNLASHFMHEHSLASASRDFEKVMQLRPDHKVAAQEVSAATSEACSSGRDHDHCSTVSQLPCTCTPFCSHPLLAPPLLFKNHAAGPGEAAGGHDCSA